MHQYIVIEGPLGVGKTSLALMLAEKLNGQTLMENVDENPFLGLFYQDPKKFGFQTQIYFLLRRYKQALELGQMDLFQNVVISDYLFDKDRIFARVNLDDNEFWLYEQLFRLLRKRITPSMLSTFQHLRMTVSISSIEKWGSGFPMNVTALKVFFRDSISVGETLPARKSLIVSHRKLTAEWSESM